MIQVYDKANLGDAMEVDEEEDASATEEAAQLPGPEEMEEDAEEEEAEAEEQEQELTLADVVSEAEAAATEAQGVVERPVEPVAEHEAPWDSEGALGVDGHAEGIESRLGQMQNRTGRLRFAPRLDK